MKQLTTMSWEFFNVEKAVFFVASIMLLYAGFQYQNIPNVRSWSAARAENLPENILPLDLTEPPPVNEFLLGSRSSPFTEQSTGNNNRVKRYALLNWPRKVVKKKSDTTALIATPPPSPHVPPPPPLPDLNQETTITETKKIKQLDKYVIPLRVGGVVSVGGGPKRAMFISEEDGKHYTLREGEGIPGTDLTVVLVTKNIVIVKNKKGERFRLDEILKASSGRNDSVEE